MRPLLGTMEQFPRAIMSQTGRSRPRFRATVPLKICRAQRPRLPPTDFTLRGQCRCEVGSWPPTQGVVVQDPVFHNFLWFEANGKLTPSATCIPYLVVTPSGRPQDGLGRGNDHSPPFALG